MFHPIRYCFPQTNNITKHHHGLFAHIYSGLTNSISCSNSFHLSRQFIFTTWTDFRYIYFSMMGIVSLNTVLWQVAWAILNMFFFFFKPQFVFDNTMRKHVPLFNKRPVPAPQYSLIPKKEWRLVSRSLKRSPMHVSPVLLWPHYWKCNHADI